MVFWFGFAYPCWFLTIRRIQIAKINKKAKNQKKKGKPTMKKTKTKDNIMERGITLISLVVCVVLLAILAAVLINISYEDVNLINTALGARETYMVETYKGV